MNRQARINILTAFFLFLSVHASASPSYSLDPEKLSAVPGIIRDSIRKGRIPGAVVVIGERDRVIYREAFGRRMLTPGELPMETDTIFDLASLTKAVATTTAVMQLSEEALLDIDRPVAHYWPEFGANGKGKIRVRDLLTHYSGLRPALNMREKWEGYEEAMSRVIGEKPVCEPGSRCIYSDINFLVLGELVRRIAGMDLDEYCRRHIFDPLGMKDTMYLPLERSRDRIAPTVKEKGRMLRGEVHDPTARAMGGLAGHAGLFSTADDLARYARMILSGGTLGDVRILKPETVDLMTSPQSPNGNGSTRGLGWDIGPPCASNGKDLPKLGSFGHKGYTGTFLWIDRVSGIYVIVLANRVHPNGKGDAGPMRKRIIETVSKAVGPVSKKQIDALSKVSSMGRVRSGIDVLAADGYRILSGKRIGLITNHTGQDSLGRRTIDLLAKAPAVRLVAIFSPEHGIRGAAEGKVKSSTDSTTGIPVHSLYGDERRPTDETLSGLDALVFDLQDAGARFYTYITTMAYGMEAAARKGIPFYVLDRPNPITAEAVQGAVLEGGMTSFTGYFPMPVRHGMTVGELATMFNEEKGIGADLHVVRMAGYERGMWFDETGLKWVDPSPNLTSMTAAVLYPGVALIEGANVSVGRGTETPFELLGAPWIDGRELADYLDRREIRGIGFSPAEFTPKKDRFRDQVCRGVKIKLIDRRVLDSPTLGLELISALWKLYPNDFRLDRTLEIIGSRKILEEIRAGLEVKEIVRGLEVDAGNFRSLRSGYLLY